MGYALAGWTARRDVLESNGNEARRTRRSLHQTNKNVKHASTSSGVGAWGRSPLKSADPERPPASGKDRGTVLREDLMEETRRRRTYGGNPVEDNLRRCFGRGGLQCPRCLAGLPGRLPRALRNTSEPSPVPKSVEL